MLKPILIGLPLCAEAGAVAAANPTVTIAAPPITLAMPRHMTQWPMVFLPNGVFSNLCPGGPPLSRRGARASRTMPCLDMPEQGVWQQSAPAGLPPAAPLPGRTAPLSKGLLQFTIRLLEAA